MRKGGRQAAGTASALAGVAAREADAAMRARRAACRPSKKISSASTTPAGKKRARPGDPTSDDDTRAIAAGFVIPSLDPSVDVESSTLLDEAEMIKDHPYLIGNENAAANGRHGGAAA